MNETYVAVLFRRTMIDDKTCGFSPITVIEGYYDESEDCFIDRMENFHTNIKDSYLSDKEDFFGLPVSLEEIKEKYNTENSGEAIEKYCDAVRYDAFLGIIDVETNDFSVIAVDSNNSKKIEEIELYETRVELPQEPEIELLTPGVNLDVKDMYREITSKVINQDEAVRKIMMNIIKHNRTVNSEDFISKYPNPQLTRCFLTGSTGSGKTLIIESVIDYLKRNTRVNIPVAKAPTSQLTAAGYVGMDLEDILEELVSKVTVLRDKKAKIKYAERNGIVFLDEIDKKGTRDNGDVSGKSVLNALLQFIDGATYRIYRGQNMVMTENSPSYYFNTKYLNIFAAGAFMDVRTAKKDTRISGFGGTDEKKQEGLSLADYIEKGEMPPEFMGRFHEVVELKTLEEQDLKKILNQSTLSPILVEQMKEASLFGLHLTWDESFIDAVAKKAYKLKTGARSLKAIIEESISQAEWDFMYNGGFSEVELTSATVEDPKVYTKKQR